MKYILAMAMTISATANVYLQSCNQYMGEQGVSFSYQLCVNNNFRAIDRELDTFLLTCSNYGDQVSYSYLSCISSNFRHATRELGVFPQYCSNFGDELSFSYQMCVNTNFSIIEREINRRN